MLDIILIGYGAIGSSIFSRKRTDTNVQISHIVELAENIETIVLPANSQCKIVSRIDEVEFQSNSIVIECAGHSALINHVLPCLQQGIDCAVLSIGALAYNNTLAELEDACKIGGSKLHVLSGAVGGIDAIVSANKAEIDEIRYIGSKPPYAWLNTPISQTVDLLALTEPLVFFDGIAHDAAQLYPQNANVSASIAIAGIGFYDTKVQLVADPSITKNIHEIYASGAFGELHIRISGKALADNPKTSALTVLSAIRFIDNLTQHIIQ